MDSLSSFLKSVLNKPGVVVLPGNVDFVKDFTRNGGRIERQPTGHLVFYREENRRILMTDPEGNPLHECEWDQLPNGDTQLVSARLHLEWGEWVGIRPGGLVNSTVLDLSSRPGWEKLTRDDLRMMAARAMNVSFEHIRFFYRDEDLVIDRAGQATIRQQKDAFYVLREGRFEGAKFMSCMSRMRWHRIDYLPVVELFLSLLPGTGSATFELIRGLYDDQNPQTPFPLHYRGIPVYPSEGAFRLFSQFFTGSVPGSSKDILSVFLDPNTSEEVIWLPCPAPPVRYFDSSNQLCVTVKAGAIQKATLGDDQSGLSYFQPLFQGLAPFGQSVIVRDGNLVVSNGRQSRHFPGQASWGLTTNTSTNPALQNFPTWHQLFPAGSPNLQPGEAFSTTLLYPDDGSPIGEVESQPFALDYFDDLLDDIPALKAQLGSASDILIANCDAAAGSCLRFDRQREITILYSHPPLAQKQAQILWNTLAKLKKLHWIDFIRFLPYSEYWQSCLEQTFDMIFFWVAFAQYHDHQSLDQTLREIHRMLEKGGTAFLVGPPSLAEHASRYNLELVKGDPVCNLPTFHLHQAILSQARVHPELMAFVFQRIP